MTAPLPEKQSLVPLALAVADAIEDQSTPASLKDSLNEIAAALADELTPSIAFQLRALALAYPEPEKSILGAQDAILEGSERESEPLAKATTR
jgi:hypothetical protein